MLGQKLEQRLGKPFVVEHKPGGGGVTGALSVARAAPDGYTIMMASSTILAFNVTMRKELAYDPRKDLTPIALLARVPFVLVVNHDLPVNSVADLVKLAKDKPGQLSFGTPGPGTFHHLNAEIFKSMFGLELVHVPYKGTAPALQDVAAGHIAVHVRRRAAGARPDRRRQGARARRHHGAAGQGAAGRSAARRGRHPGLRHRVVAHHHHHRRRAEGHRRQARRRNPRAS